MIGAAAGLASLLSRSMKPQDEFSLMSFQKTVRVTEDFTKDRAKIENAFRRISPNGCGTAVIDAVAQGISYMKKAANKRRALVLFSDTGETEGGSLSAQRLAAEEIRVYTFGITVANTPQRLTDLSEALRRADCLNAPTSSAPGLQKVVEALAKSSGGRSIVEDIRVLNTSESKARRIEFLEQIDLDVRGQYTLAYYTAWPRGGLNPPLRIRPAHPGHRVQFRVVE